MKLQPPDAGNVGHRFTRDDGAVVDVLAADFRGRSRPHLTIPPASTVEVPGGRALLADTNEVRVIHDGRSGEVERPSLIAAIVGKWRAFAELVDDRRAPTVTSATPPGCSPTPTPTPSPRRRDSARTSDDCSPRSRRDLSWRMETTTSSSTRSSC